MSDNKILVGDMSRKQCLEVLKRLLEAMETFDGISPSPERINALKMAIASLEVDEAYQLEFEKPGFCEDCISREQAKAAIRDKFKDLPSRVEINTILNELPAVTPQEPRWIPVTERVTADTVLCCDKYKNIIIGCIYPDGFGYTGFSAESDDGCVMYDVVAWMPLPLPWKEE